NGSRFALSFGEGEESRNQQQENSDDEKGRVDQSREESHDRADQEPFHGPFALPPLQCSKIGGIRCLFHLLCPGLGCRLNQTTNSVDAGAKMNLNVFMI